MRFISTINALVWIDMSIICLSTFCTVMRGDRANMFGSAVRNDPYLAVLMIYCHADMTTISGSVLCIVVCEQRF